MIDYLRAKFTLICDICGNENIFVKIKYKDCDIKDRKEDE